MSGLLILISAVSIVSSTKIDGFIGSLGPVHTGVFCQNSSTGEVIYSHNSDYLFIPASTQKLSTIAGSLLILGKDFRFHTYLLADSVRGNTAHNIIMRGSGDPSFDWQSMRFLSQQLKSKGIDRIEGNIYLYARDLDTLPYGVGWMWDEGYYSYSASISALSCCGNSVELTLSISSGNIVADYEPKSEFVQIVNLLSPGGENNYKVVRYFDGERNIIVVSGTLRSSVERSVNIEKPELFTGYLFQEALKEQSVWFSGNIVTIQSLPAIYETAAVWISEPLYVLSDSIFKYSLNLASELLIRKIASQKYPGASSLEGIGAILQRFNQLGLSTSGLVLKDGCGLSRYNLSSPKFLTYLLSMMLKQNSLSSVFFNCLPVMGKEGTVQTRLRRISNDRVRAKTGTLSGVSSIAGYILSEGGDTLSFAILMNNFTSPQSAVKQVQDSIIYEFMKY